MPQHLRVSSLPAEHFVEYVLATNLASTILRLPEWVVPFQQRPGEPTDRASLTLSLVYRLSRNEIDALMESERWPETRFPARFHPDLTAISERPSEELALREAHQARFESSNEPAYWSTESGTREERSPPANGTVAKVRTQRSKQNVADQAFGDNDDGPNWLHDPTTLPDSPSVRHGRLQRRAGGYFRHRASSLRSCRTRVNGPLALRTEASASGPRELNAQSPLSTNPASQMHALGAH
ncbi:hypothetical protein MTO96_035350 [Rhipicephalus appendiculatus]